MSVYELDEHMSVYELDEYGLSPVEASIDVAQISENEYARVLVVNQDDDSLFLPVDEAKLAKLFEFLTHVARSEG